MTAAFGTLAFLVTLWLLVVVVAAILEGSGAKIAAALKGQSLTGQSPALVPVRVRTHSRMNAPQAPMRAEPRQRAAA